MLAKSVEQKMLKSSLSFTLILAVLSIIVGFRISSHTILIDGISSLSSCITTLVSLSVVKFISKKNEKKYPFGKEILQPFVAVVNYGLLLLLCVVMLVNTMRMIISGGNEEILVTSSILYGVFYMVVSFIIYKYLKSLTKSHPTPILELEVLGWKFGVFVSVGMVLGFGFSGILNLMGLYAFTAYIDPVLTIIVMFSFVKTLMIELKNCLRELLQASPVEEVFASITMQLEKAESDYDYTDKVLRLGKVGKQIRIEIDYIIEKDSKLDSIIEQDKLRKALTQACDELPFEKWINIGFTSEVCLTKHMI